MRNRFTNATLVTVCATALAACTTTAAVVQGTEPVAGSPTHAFVAADARKSLEMFAQLLEENYLYADIGKRYAEFLRAQLARNAYADFPSAAAFASTVERDLRAVHYDDHLHLNPPSISKNGVVAAEGFKGGTCPQGGTISRSMGKSGWLAPGVAYVEFCAFGDQDVDIEALRAFLARYSGAKTLIVDNRANNGGGFVEMNLIMSHLFGKPTELFRLDIRRSVDEKDPFPGGNEPEWEKLPPTEQMARYAWYARPANVVTGLRDAKVFVLNSPATVSAGEAFALALQRTGRATVIGDRTKGAAHLAPTWGLAGGYRGQLSIGRTYNPDTGKSHERVGIQPDVKVPAEKALEEALRRAGVDVQPGLRAWQALPTAQTAG